MKHLIVSMWLMYLSCSLPLFAKIIEAYALKEISGYFENLDTQSLILWDVDSTLIIPIDNILRPGHEDFFDALKDLYIENRSDSEKEWLLSQIFQHCSFCLVDPDVGNMIMSMQKKSIPMIAFTAMHTGSFGTIENMEDWRVNQLYLLGIDFSSNFAQHSILNWKEKGTYGGSPVFKKGVLCSDRVPKGIVISTFLKKINWIPAQVIFIDDNIHFIKSVAKAMKNLKIPFIGVHYRAVEKLESQMDEMIAHHQFQVLVNRRIWLSDSEAQTSLRHQQSQEQSKSFKRRIKLRG